MRFKDNKDSQHFLLSLCKEVSLRLQGCGVQGRTFTLKIKKRRKNAEEPTKYMGCGDCENLSHSTTVPVATDDVDVLQRISMRLFGSFRIDVKDIRGIGLQVTRLESADITRQGHERNTIRSWLASGAASASEQCISRGRGHSTVEPSTSSSIISDQVHRESSSNPVATMPSLDDLDMGVIESLPPELFAEINDVYGGKLIDLISKKNGKVSDKSSSAISAEKVEGKMLSELEAYGSLGVRVDNIQRKDKAGLSGNQERQNLPNFGVSTATAVRSAVESGNIDLMPSSLSQVDTTVLQQLPEELRTDIIGALPAHRRSNCSPDSGRIPMEEWGTGDHSGFSDAAEGKNLWVGNPPYWVHKFKSSNCLMLNILAETYMRSESAGALSSVLQCCLSGFQIFSGISEEEASEASNGLCELLRQYIQLKLAVDIEEIYVCFRLLKRLTLKSKAFLRVYEVVLPHLQGCIGESYGGLLHLPPP